MDDVRDRVDLMDGWYVRRGDGRIGRGSDNGSSIEVNNLTDAGFTPGPDAM